jgi:RNA polymerase sigma factor (sigma-70 family)
MDPDDIIRALRSGAKWGDQAMVTVVAPVLLGYAASIAPDLSPTDHESAVEAAILRGVRKLNQFDRRRGTFAGWLRPFVRHAISDLRRSRPGSTASLPDDIAAPDAEAEIPAPQEEVRAIRSALAALSDTDRLIITLRDFERLSYDSCAERIGGVSAAACRVRHLRAVHRLRDAAQGQPALQKYFVEEQA